MDDLYEIEQRKQARDILRSLVLNLHPTTRKPIPSSEILNEPQVIRALVLAVEALDSFDRTPATSEIERPSRAGRSWTTEEDNELRNEFEQRLPLEDISSAHQRTSGSIIARLVRLKLVNERDDARKIFAQKIRSTR